MILAKSLDGNQDQGWELRTKRNILQLSVAHWTSWNWPSWRGENMDLFNGSSKLSDWNQKWMIGI